MLYYTLYIETEPQLGQLHVELVSLGQMKQGWDNLNLSYGAKSKNMKGILVKQDKNVVRSVLSENELRICYGFEFVLDKQ